MKNSTLFMVFIFLAGAISATAQERSDNFPVFVAGINDAAPVAQSLIRKLNATKPFEVVTSKDPSKVAVLISCTPRSKPADPFACMYVAQYNGATFKTFLGGGLFFATNADAVASNFLESLAQDIVERYDSTNMDNLREALESCLLMTDFKCNVPDPLQKEFNAKQLTLGQYLLKKHQ
jgi:hypothetical protein